MKILTGYLLREHVAPFVAALAVLTGLMLLNQLARRFGDLVGKGLPWHVIAEVFGLSIPFILAMTMPMAVLVAVLYTFSRLSGDNEITAIRAGGIGLFRLMVPVLLASGAVASGMIWFNDHVLPESNHALRQLLTDIGRKRPTFELRERVINEVVRDKLFLQAARIERGRNLLRDLVIFDLGRGDAQRTIYADSGQMGFNPAQTDLFLTLYDGSMHEQDISEPGKDQRTYYVKQIIRVPEVSNELERGGSSSWRGDREMTIAMMQSEIRSRRENLKEIQDSIMNLAGTLTPSIAAHETVDSVPAAGERRTIPLLEETGVEKIPPREGRSARTGPSADSLSATGTKAAAQNARAPTRRDLRAAALRVRTQDWPPGVDPAVYASRVRASFQQLASRREVQRRDINRYAVEIHKKYAIPVAAIVFVLIGAPIGVRFPRGGIGMVIGVSLAVFCVYYVGLIGGEDLADRTIITPFWAMWAPNLIFAALGLGTLLWVSREGGRWAPWRRSAPPPASRPTDADPDPRPDRKDAVESPA